MQKKKKSGVTRIQFIKIPEIENNLDQLLELKYDSSRQ